jgi:hypothetical protein
MAIFTPTRFVLAAFLLLGALAPVVTQAAEPPVCMLGVVSHDIGKVFSDESVSVPNGVPVYILWASTRATAASNGGTPIGATGVVMVQPSKTSTYSYTFTNSEGSVTCRATLEVGEAQAQGPTTLRVSNVPLLSGGVAYPGASVPVTYLQIHNTGVNAATVTGIALEQKGSTDTDAIIGLSVIDDKGVSVAVTGGGAVSTPFSNGEAVASMDAVIAPGQRRLFTIRAMMAPILSSFKSSSIILDVTGVETSASVVGAFPIRGTVWNIQ